MAYTVLTTNSTTVALSYGHSFVGEWVSVLSYPSLQIATVADCAGVLYIDSSSDGITTEATESRAYGGASSDMIVRYTVTRRYVRVRFTNTQQIHLHQTTLRIQTLGSTTLLTGSTIAGTSEDLDGSQCLKVAFGDIASLDAFGRLRVSNPVTVFDSKLIEDAAPLFWDDSQVSGGGTSTSHSTNTASQTIGVSTTTAGRRVRQTFQSFNYQPGKSFLIFMTGVIDKSGGGTGITRRIGYYDDQNGLFFEDEAGTYKVVRRTYVTGSAVDNEVSQSSWNTDPMDGSGPSGVVLDFTKTQIFVIDFEWLGVGRVRMGFVVDGHIYYCHQFLNTNSLTEVYMSTPNLPLRYEIINDGTGAASTLEQICSSIIVEGGNDKTGIVRSASTNGTHVDANAIDTLYAVVGLRKKTNYKTQVTAVQVGMLSETADNFEWSLWLNPTVAGSFTYSDEANSAVQVARGATANTVSGGTLLQCGWSTSSAAVASLLETNQRLGTSIAGTRDEVVLAVRPSSSNADIQGVITWREGI